jgi:hypothetical protein
MNNKKHTAIYLTGLFSIALALVFMISPNNNNVAAQQSSTMTPNVQQRNPYSMSMSSSLQQSQNWTGSISLFSPILDAFKSKVQMTLNGAITNAMNAVGGEAGSNSSAVAAFIHPERGFLVYNVFVLDSNNNIHRVIVDPGNGKVLFNQQMSMMEMMSMMHPSMGMGMMMGTPQGMTMNRGMMGGPGMGMMMGPSQGMMMNRDMMMGPNEMMMEHGNGMGGMMGPQDGSAWP